MNRIPSLRSIAVQKHSIKGEARPALLLSSLLVLVTIGLFALMAHAATIAGKPVYGPENFSRGLHFRFFQVAAPTGQYTLSVQNGNPLTGQNRADSAVVTLNEKVVVGLRDLTATTASVEKPVTLRKLNVITVLVVGKKGSFITFSIRGQTANTPPVGNAGPDQTGKVNTTVTLDGSASSDFDGNLLTYNWSLTSKPIGSTALLTNPSTVNPTLFLDKPGTYVGSLVVNDGLVNSAPDTVTVSTINSPPTANAGANQTARVTNTVTLDGSGSTDPDGNPLTFSWTLTSKPTGSTAALSSATAVKPTFTVDKPGTYVAQLIVNDGTANSVASQVTVSTENTPPVANAGPDQSLPLKGLVTLDGSASSDVDGDLLTYTWSFASTPLGSVATLSDATAVNPTFTVDKPGSYTLQLIVKDGIANSLADTVVITTENSKPVADAGPDQSALIRQTVILDGTKSSDADNDTLTYAWSFVSKPTGSTAALLGATAPQPSFTLDKSGTYVVQLIVNDGKVDSVADTVTISTLNSKPVADAGPPQNVPVGTLAHLTGLASSDADGDVLSYAWAFTTKPATSAAVLSDATVAEPTSLADVAGTWVLQLTVSDGKVSSDPNTVTITVEPAVSVNTPPTFTSIPVTQATEGQGYSYQATAIDGNSDTLTYALTNSPQNMDITATGLVTWIPSATQVGDFPITLTVTDNKSPPIVQTFTITVQAALVTVPDVGGLSQTVAQTAITGAGLTVGTITQAASATVAAGNVISQNPLSGASAAKNSAVALVVSTGAVITGDPLPPDPATIAPKIDPTVATTVSAATQFLYTGTNPIQTGVAPGTIEAKRAAVIRGKVLDKQNNPLSGVTITINKSPEFGQTLSRADGLFDMAVNGGGLLTINYKKSGYLPVQRQVSTTWQNYVFADNVTMIQQDPKVTTIDLNSITQDFQLAQGSTVTDDDGIRQATLLIPKGTKAQVYNQDGTTKSISTLNLRLTEYTVGLNGPESMPASLPPSSAYTYAFEMKAEEADVKIDGKDVLFDRPVPFYIDNFLSFPVGTVVPVGYYDRDKATWIPSDNGKVIKIFAINNGVAEIDSDNDNLADDPTKLLALGITTEERTQLASLYQVGKTLWRVQVTHLSTWDCNWPYKMPDDAVQPTNPPPSGDVIEDNPDIKCNSILECENQVLGESLPVTGSPYSLNYRSNRERGRKAANNLQIPVSGGTLPVSVKRIDLIIEIAGRRMQQSLQPTLNQKYLFIWDGLDAFGRLVQGIQPVTIKIGYVYDPVYATPAQLAAAFARFSGVPLQGSSVRNEVRIWQEETSQVSLWSNRSDNIGTWSLNAHHSYDPVSQTLYYGNGTQRSILGTTINGVINTIAGGGNPFTVSGIGDGGPATSAIVQIPRAVVVAADGTFYFSSQGRLVRRVTPDGIITTVAGISSTLCSEPSCGDGGLATNAILKGVSGLAIATDGSLYISETTGHRIRRVTPNGIINTVAGTGVAGFSGDGGLATSAQLFSPSGVALGGDGSLYISERDNFRLRKVNLDGIISTIAGNGTIGNTGKEGDGGPAANAILQTPSGVAVGSDGSVYVADSSVRRITPDGIISTVAGGRCSTINNGDGGQALQASLCGALGVAVAPDNTLYIAESQRGVRRVTTDGIISTVAGGGSSTTAPQSGVPAKSVQVFSIEGDLAVGPDGSVYIADSNNSIVRRVEPTLPGFVVGEVILPSADGSLLYRFDSTGRHLVTLNALTGATLLSFSYDAQGNLSQTTDADSLITHIERDALGNPTAIVAPFGQKTTLVLDGNGYLAKATNPAGEFHQMAYTPDGLMTSFTDPRGNASTFTYDSLGRLLNDVDASTGGLALSRTELADGHAVAVTSTLNRVSTHAVRNLTTGDKERKHTQSDNTVSTTLEKADGTLTTTDADGTLTTLLLGPDPRFSMLAPITKSLQTSTGGLTANFTSQSTAVLATPSNQLSLTTLTDTVTLNGRTATSVFDAATKTFTSTSPAARQSKAVIDNIGRLTQAQVTGILPVNNTYDPQGRHATIAQGSGVDERLVSFTYNPQGYLDTVTDPIGRQVKYEYDLAGRVTRQILPDTREILFTYDANGNLASLLPPGKPAHSFTYTPVNLTASYVPPNVGAGTNSTLYSYNLDKQLTQVQRPDGLTMAFSYDTAGRPSTMTVPEGNYSFGYNPTTGKLTSVTTPDGLGLNYTFTGALPTQTSWSGTVAGNVGKTYDNSFRASAISVNGANPFTYQYDNDSLLTAVGNTTLGISFTLARNAQNGLLTGTALGSLTDSYTYNGFGEVTSYLAKFATADMFKTDFTRDKLGRITHKVETVGGVTHAFDYTYDLAGRLVEVKQDNLVQESYGYDDNGNRTQLNGVPIAHYDAQDRLLDYNNVTFGYTANGELKSRTVGAATTSYNYDVLGNLRHVILSNGTNIDYVIDGQNRRIGKKRNGVLEQGFFYQDQLKPIAELDGNGAIRSRFIYATGVNVPDFMIKGGATYRLVKDHLGSPRLIVDITTNTVIQSMSYDAWGNVLFDSNPGFQPFGFAGGIYDRDTGLVRFGARDYDAVTGRWATKDPIRFNGKSPNIYGYAFHEPINLVDPFGLKIGKGCVGVINSIDKLLDAKRNGLLAAGASSTLALEKVNEQLWQLYAELESGNLNPQEIQQIDQYIKIFEDLRAFYTELNAGVGNSLTK